MSIGEWMQCCHSSLFKLVDQNCLSRAGNVLTMKTTAESNFGCGNCLAIWRGSILHHLAYGLKWMLLYVIFYICFTDQAIFYVCITYPNLELGCRNNQVCFY